MRRLSVVPIALVIGLSGVAGSVTALQQGKEPPKAGRHGWWIRVSPEQTTATAVEGEFGPKAGEPAGKFTWAPQRPVEFDLSTTQPAPAALHLAARSTPADGSVSFCVFFGTQGVAYFSFKGEQARQLSQTARVPQCVP